MGSQSELHIHECIFQFYLEHRLHGLCSGIVHNKLLGTDLDSLALEVGESHNGLLLVKDIPDYLQFEAPLPKDMNSLRIPQYHGYLIKLKGYRGIDDFLQGQLSKRNLKNLKAKKRKLEQLGTVECQILTGPQKDGLYKTTFETFEELLKRRFDNKKIHNRYLMDWQGLYHRAHPRLVEGKALLFLIQLDGKPIGMALDYILESCVFSHIQTFDPEYSKFNMGDLMLHVQLEWCLDHGKSILDLSKGENAYKEKWCNHRYRLYHELIYPRSSLLSALRAGALALKYTTIQKLRELGLLGNIINVDRLLYKRHRRNVNDPIQAEQPL